jgi:uncharacterized protein YndB with AHSA1/START domain
MPVVSTTKDPDALTLTLVSEYAADPERIWQLWEDPRQLEWWWGPPSWPATFEQHDFTVGGVSHFYMAGPAGDKARGWWRFTAIQRPDFLEFDDGFSDDSGAPDPHMPTMRVHDTLEAIDAGTRMTTTTHFGSVEQMQELLAMGIVVGSTLAAGQIDALHAG